MAAYPRIHSETRPALTGGRLHPQLNWLNPIVLRKVPAFLPALLKAPHAITGNVPTGAIVISAGYRLFL